MSNTCYVIVVAYLEQKCSLLGPGTRLLHCASGKMWSKFTLEELLFNNKLWIFLDAASLFIMKIEKMDLSTVRHSSDINF